ncbi:hypothetical protein T05_12065 [Trichinella murrelli]|uniref:Uncharacterized protein n=1 Tax=Trichinella murrelli TaxID=144512 RepID=A0A0V0SS95_9BILA|nr:hypothetical protein T05_12065 [Trichinella murrelli]
MRTTADVPAVYYYATKILFLSFSKWSLCLHEDTLRIFCINV